MPVQNNPSYLRRSDNTVAPSFRRLALLGSVGLFALFALGACQMRGNVRPFSSEAPLPPVFVDAKAPAYCRAAEARYALGKTITQALLEELKQKTGARLARAGVGDPETKDSNDQRLTVDLDATGRIVGARCG